MARTMFFICSHDKGFGYLATENATMVVGLLIDVIGLSNVPGRFVRLPFLLVVCVGADDDDGGRLTGQ